MATDFVYEDEIEHLPPPEWLVDGILPEGGLCLLYGPPAGGKTFLALGLAFSVALGRPWLGRRAKQGPVIYLAGEGVAGLPSRLRAWKEANAVGGRADIRFPRKPVKLDPRSGGLFVDELLKMQPAPVLVVVDTLARAMVGSDEDSAKDMGEFVQLMGRITTEIRATVLILHHPLKNKPNQERGSSALRGAVDSAWRLSNPRGALVLSCEKQKDAEMGDEIPLTLKQVQLVDGGTSCVIEGNATPDVPIVLPAEDQRVLDALGEDSLRSVDWQKRVPLVAPRTFERIKGRLELFGRVERVLNGSTTLFRAAPNSTALPLPNHCHTTAMAASPNATATTAPPSIEGAGGSGGAKD